jgi:hypothetical protein
MPLSEKQANYIIDVNIHVIILFTFLSLFFFKYIAVITEAEIDRTTSNLIKKNISTSFDTILNKLKTGRIDINNANFWTNVRSIGTKISDDATGKDPKVTQINKKLVVRALFIVTILVIILVIMILYCYINQIPIHFLTIIVNNLVLFIFIAVMEYTFFTYIAKNYRASAPDDMTNTLYTEIQTKIDDSLKK